VCRFLDVSRLFALLPVLTGSGCESSAAGGGGEARDGGQSQNQILMPDENGWIDGTTTGTTMIQGSWWSVSDREGCLGVGHAASECSLLITPDETAQNFPPTVVQGIDLGMCVVGITARVINDPSGALDFSNIWGFGIAINLNLDEAYDAQTNGVVGFAFDIDAEPPPRGGIRVALPTESAPGGEAAWWGGASADTSPVHAGHNEFRWAVVAGPNYRPSPPPFDPTQILSIGFQVPADQGGAKTSSFCIRNLTALRN
jgi:hypothetical protein